MRATILATLVTASSIVLGGCVEHKPSTTAGTVSSINVTLKSPTPGTPSAPNTDLNAVIDVDAFLDDGVTPFPGQLDLEVYISLGGVLTGLPTNCGDTTNTPVAELVFTNGHIADQKITIPVAYGTTTIWVQDKTSHVAGSSTPIYFPNPTIPQIQTPVDQGAANATFCSEYDRKFLTVDHATGSGELIVDSLFQGALTVVDTGAVDTGFSTMYVYTFGAPSSDIMKGSKISSFSGNISKFVGFTELNFPVVTADDSVPPDPSKLPAPIVLSDADPANVAKLNAIDGRTVQVSGVVCPPSPANPTKDPTIQQTDDEWTKYNTFVLGDPASQTCDSYSEFSVQMTTKAMVKTMPDGTTQTFDPTVVVATPITVTGMLKNSSGQNQTLDINNNPIACSTQKPCAGSTQTCQNGFCYNAAYNFWTIVLRDGNDLVSFTPNK